MSTNSKTKFHAPNSTSKPLQSPGTARGLERLSPKLRLVKNLTDKGEYQRALEALSNNTADPEELNCRGVCLLRMHEFVKAIGPLRMVALNSRNLRIHEHVANHIKVNYALALFFGGEPRGGLDALSEFKASENDPSVLMLRRQLKQWVEGMKLLRRIDWYLNRIAPPKGPVPPDEPIGQFLWDLENFQ